MPYLLCNGAQAGRKPGTTTPLHGGRKGRHLHLCNPLCHVGRALEVLVKPGLGFNCALGTSFCLPAIIICYGLPFSLYVSSANVTQKRKEAVLLYFDLDEVLLV